MGVNKSKIDRVLVNSVWLDKFPDSEAVFLAPSVSDHCAILVTVLPEVYVRRPFKFFNFWLKNSNFKEAIVSSWDSPLVCSVRSRLGLKLKRLKPVLKGLNQHYYSDISGRVTQLRMELGQIQAQFQGDPDNIALQEREQEVYLNFVEMSGAEEAFKKQKSRVQWLALGDQNTQFFHHKLKSHCVRHKILSLNTSTGVRLTDPTEIKKEILGYYEGLLGSSFDQKMDAYPALRLALTRKYKMVQSGFVFHPKCQPLQLSHLIFADDLFVLSGANPQSFETIQDTLQDFYLFSGLKPNMQKSSIFFAGVSHHDKLQLCTILPIPEGVLPVKSVLSLADERSWACSYKAGKSLEHLVYRLSLAASLYWIWRERNLRIF
ncbi:hypothetical protein Vadar_021656 [Vaccinium darrowii]|uniref:Uncharacterized protein n=1 Tax=Vaccinium darrowii TaxID=229202 RepID=A0ACB7XJA1_9ERIC|nr:hypothetical protein Vadar_021656 [Vaccinium darrowii]